MDNRKQFKFRQKKMIDSMSHTRSNRKILLSKQKRTSCPMMKNLLSNESTRCGAANDASNTTVIDPS